MDLVLSKNKMEANGTEYSNVQVELKDRYNNLVFNDSSTIIDLEILDQYSHIITADTTSQLIKE
jgi:hypothetical protein